MFLMGAIGEIPSSPWWAWVLKIILGIIITIPVFRYAQGAVQQAVVYKSFTHNHRYDTALGGEIFTAMHDDYPLTITRTGAGRYQLDRPDWKAPKTLQANPDL